MQIDRQIDKQIDRQIDRDMKQIQIDTDEDIYRYR